MSRAIATMSRTRRWQLGALLAVFWFAQVQGVVHDISHLSDAARVAKTLGAPKPQTCPECLALAQAGAAPVSVLPDLYLLDVDVQQRITAATAHLPATPRLAYRSRAPPLSRV